MSTPNYEAQAARLWAANVNLTVPARGRVPKAIMNRFQALPEDTQAQYISLARNGHANPVQATDNALAAMGEPATATQRVYQPAPEEEPTWVKEGRAQATAKALDRITRAQQLCEMAIR